MTTPPPCIHPDDALTGPWQTRVAELLTQAEALIPADAHWKCRANLGEVVTFWMFLPAPELQERTRKANRAARNQTLALDMEATL
jgi:hypothetical protein